MSTHLDADALAKLCRSLIQQTREMADMIDALLPPPKAVIRSAFQQGILDALDGKALRTDALAVRVGSRSRLFAKDGLPELQEEGVVAHDKRVGYYRPDAPPADFVR